MTPELKQEILTKWEEEALEVVEDGDWVSEHKYELRDSVVEYNGKFYCIAETRSGSYYSDYDYQEPEVYEVVPKQVTKTVWVTAK